MNDKDLITVNGFSVYPLGQGRQLELGTPDGKLFKFAITQNLIEPLRENLQNPMPNPTAGFSDNSQPISNVVSSR